MPDLDIAGCHTTPLGSYLTAVGLLRAVSRTLEGQAAGHWVGRRFTVTCSASSVEELITAMHRDFRPEPIVSPWNAGSGFAGNGTNTTAEEGLRWVRESDDPRLAILRTAVAAADRVTDSGRARGWAGKGKEMWDKAAKPQLFALCRAEFPDAALPWLDAAVALGPDEQTTFSRLLGTGGNFGRQDLSATYITRVRAAISDPRSGQWLRALLTGDETVPYLRDPVGQFDPGRAGGIQSSPLEKRDDKGFVNPWAFVFTVEGTLLFASAMVRRHGTQSSHVVGSARAALPFQVPGTTGVHDTAAPAEPVLAEIFAPEWSEPLRLAELEHLLGEGRADWRRRPARTALDVVRSIATLGVDRGIGAFQRHVIVDRLGQNPLAIAADRIVVAERGTVRLLARLDPWLDSLHRTSQPAQVATQIRALERAVYQHATSGLDTDLVDLIASLGRAHETVSRSRVVRRTVSPLVLDQGRTLLETLQRPAAHDQDLRIALALAASHDQAGRLAPSLGGLRPVLSPVQASAARRVVWTDRPTPAPLASGLIPALAEAARRRSFPGEVADPANAEIPGVRGVRIAFNRGLRLRASDLHAIVHGVIDLHRVADLLAGLLTVDWQDPDGDFVDGTAILDPAVNMLLPFASPTGLTIRTETGSTRTLLVRPGSDWPVKLAAGQIRQVLADAHRRLRIGGLRFVITPSPSDADGAALAATLLLPVSRADNYAALRRIAVGPATRTTPEPQTTQETSA